MNNGFNKTELQFTYLVPTDKAWENLKTGDFASAYKVRTQCEWIISIFYREETSSMYVPVVD